MNNTGYECTPIMEVTKKLIFMPVFGSDGAKNYIDLSSPLDAAAFTALINESDPFARIYPTPEIKDIKDTRDVPVTQDFPDGSKVYIRDQVRKFQGMIVGKNATTALKAKLESSRCGEMGVFYVDRLGNLIGNISDDGTKLYPVRLDPESLSANLTKSTDTTTQLLDLQFNINPFESDSCLRMIKAEEMGDADLLSIKGLVDVYATFSSISTTGFTVKLFTEYNTVLNPNVVKGLVIADFVSANNGATSQIYRTNNTPGNQALDTVTESVATPGTYDVVFDFTASTGDKFLAFMKKNGYDFTHVKDSAITIP